MVALYPDLSEISTRLESCTIELKDIALEIESVEQKITFNPERISLINEKLDFIYRLQQKHRVNTIKELIEIKDEISKKLDSLISLDQQVGNIKNQIDVSETYLAGFSSEIQRTVKVPFRNLRKA
jgi:DNA repair protein RecN (Recombination protein N)